MSCVFWEKKKSSVTCAFGFVWVQFVTKMLQYDEFIPAASRGTIPSGFTLRWCCFLMCASWLGVDSTVLTHVTISRWRWALAAFKKTLWFHWKHGDFPHQMAKATHREKVEESINGGLRVKKLQSCLLIHQPPWDFCLGASRKSWRGFRQAVPAFICPDTSDTSCWWVHG